MTIVITRTRVCDLHARQGDDVEATRRTITVDGKRLTPDLCDPCHEEHVGGFLALFQEPEPKGKRRRPSKAVTDKAATNGTVPRASARDVRKWAKEHGVEVPASGRLPREVQERYAAAH